MRGLVQRVLKASVTVGDEVVGSIGKGICVLVGISKDDTPVDAEWLVRKLLAVRIFDDDAGRRWTKSVADNKLEILCISQFTLYSVLKGNKVDFHGAMGPDQSEQFYNDFLKHLRSQYNPELVKDGRFGAYMQVHIQNDGPVTIDLQSPPECAKQYRDKKEKEELRRLKQAKHAAAQKAKAAEEKQLLTDGAAKQTLSDEKEATSASSTDQNPS